MNTPTRLDLAVRIGVLAVAAITGAGFLAWGAAASWAGARPAVLENIPPGCTEVTVQPGDTLNAIAAIVGTQADAIVDLNHIEDPDVIHIGQRLVIECADGTVAAGDEATEHAPAPPAPPTTPKEIGATQAANRGWTGQQWKCLETLWHRESGWNPNAQNPTSTAYGVAQFLDKTWTTVGAIKTADPAQQITAGLDYIAQRYGTPCDAWSHWINQPDHHWY